MKKNAVKFILAVLLIVLMGVVGACSSEEKSQSPQETAAPQVKDSQEAPAAAAVKEKPMIKETPIEKPVLQEQAEEAATETFQASESEVPVQDFGTVQEEFEMEDVPPAPEVESQASVTEEASAPEPVQTPRGGAAQP